MKLELNLSGVNVQLQINDWSSEDIDIAWGNWCDVQLLFSGEYFNYDASGEILTNSEIRRLCTSLGSLYYGKMKQQEHLSFVEPDIEFILRPARRINNIPGKLTIIPDGYMYEDMSGDLRVYLNEDGYTDHYFSMSLKKRELYALYVYLLVITKQTDESDDAVKELIAEKVLITGC